MSNVQPQPHPDPETLLRLVDQDLPPEELLGLRTHLDGCTECRDRLREMDATLEGYTLFHQAILKPTLEAPHRDWSELPFPTPKVVRFRPLPWLSAAAAIAALVFLAVRFEHAPEARAAELLRKAAAAEQTAPPSRRRIRIRSRSRSVVRSAKLESSSSASETADEFALHQLFDAAGYPWDDPLTVASFAHWRNGLAEKRDEVSFRNSFYLLQTSTTNGTLSDADLTLRADDLHAVTCTLHFRTSGETIHLTELPFDAAAPEPQPSAKVLPPAVEPGTVPAPATPAGPADELRVVAALHRIGADLGEPVAVQRQGPKVMVRVSGLDQKRRDQIRSALAALPVAELRFEDAGRATSPAPLPSARATAPADRNNPLISDLASHLGNNVSVPDLTDELLDATDHASERAFALRSLARRFPSDTVAQLSPPDAAELRTIVHDHAVAFAAAIQSIRGLLAPILPPAVSSPAANPANWQTFGETLPDTIERLDRAVNGATDAGNSRKSEVTGILAGLETQTAALQRTVSQ